MLFSLALIFIFGFSLSGLLQKLKMPGLLGMLIVGMLFGPYALNLLVPEILDISAELRQIALIVILIRAGLAIDLKDLKKVGRPAFLMCFIPASLELIAVTLLAPLFFQISYLEAAIMGAVLAAVSPAVVVPRMLKLMENGYGKKNSIPQLIMAAASVDDIYVIVLFTSFLSMYQEGTGFQITNLLKLPLAIILGLLLGIGSGLILVWFFKKYHMRDTVKMLIIFSIAFLFVSLETLLKPILPISGLLAVMALGATILKIYYLLAKRLSGKFSKVWVGAELLLFVLVGAAVNISYLASSGLIAVGLIFSALLFRMLGVFICLIKTKLDKKERLFCGIAYLPKATVQAAIGAIPLAVGVSAGEKILTVAVLAIILTAPLGALAIDLAYKKLLSREKTDHL